MSEPLSDEALDRVFREARSFNHYLDRPVDEATLHALWDLVRWGPTSANQEPGRFVWCRSAEAKARLAGCCSDSNRAKVLAAPVTAIVAMDLAFYERLPELYGHVDARAWFVGKPDVIRESAFRNSTLQGAYLIVAARMLGLDAGPMSGFDADAVNGAFFAGTEWRANFIATLGYGDRATLRPRHPRLSFDDANHIV